ncbi:hypothetical protein TRFO_29667 [Tritrichomonas foetus]|uniref:Uncharacterized protein n=1 Tax=Tritrichomonas foetus TaxID=1144522 RepID=A0A1J4JX59_9EUKA|nr:hypothetical protein TRFO_29667 [Tritrichomonas foetus]|eukprot:OHT03048.1 hypothetical protein TRFO_29667 [Tritrichomonas foetus]
MVNCFTKYFILIMSFIGAFFQDNSYQTEADVDQRISDIEKNINIQANIVLLIDYSESLSTYICEKGIPSIINVLIQNKNDNNLCVDIFQLFQNLLMKDETREKNASLILNHDLIVPVLIDFLESPIINRKLAVLRIFSNFSVFQPVKFQKVCLDNTDRLIHMINLMTKETNEKVIIMFLKLIPCMIYNEPEVQQIFAFNFLERLLKLVHNNVLYSISALTSILKKNTKVQNLFFDNESNFSIYIKKLKNEDEEILNLFIDFLSYQENSENILEFIEKMEITSIVFQKVEQNKLKFILILSHLIKNINEKKKLNSNKEILKKIIINFMLATEQKEFLYFSFFENYLYQNSEGAYQLAEMIAQVKDRSTKQLIKLATITMIINPSSKIWFLSNPPNFTSSIIGYFISRLFFEETLRFLIVLCWESKTAVNYFIDEDSQPLNFLNVYIESEKSPRIRNECILLKMILENVTGHDIVTKNFVANNDKICELKNIIINDNDTISRTEISFVNEISNQLSSKFSPTKDTQSDDNNSTNLSSNHDNFHKTDYEYLNQKSLIDQVKIMNQNETEEEESKSNKEQEIKHEELIEHYENLVSQLTNEKMFLEESLKAISFSNVGSNHANSFDEQKIYQEMKEKEKELLNEQEKHKTAILSLENTHKMEIENLKQQLSDSLLINESNLVNISKYQKEIKTLKKNLQITNNHNKPIINQKQNDERKNESTEIQKKMKLKLTEAKNQIRELKQELSLMREQNYSILDHKCLFIEDGKKKFQKVIEENITLKEANSKISKELDNYKNNSKTFLSQNSLDNDLLMNENLDLMQKMNEKEKENLTLKREIQELKIETDLNNKRKIENEKLLNKINILETENQLLKTTTDRNENHDLLSNLKHEITEKESYIKEILDKNEGLLNKIKDLEDEKDKIIIKEQEKLYQQESTLKNHFSLEETNFTSKIKQFQEQINSLNQEKEKLNEKIIELNQKNSNLEENKNNLQNKINEFEQKQAQSNQFQEEIQNLSLQLENSKGICKQLTDENSVLSQNLIQASVKEKQMETLINNMKEQKLKIEEEYRSLKIKNESFEHISSRFTILKKEKEELKTKLIDKEFQENSYNSQFVEFNEKIEEIKAQKDDIIKLKDEEITDLKSKLLAVQYYIKKKEQFFCEVEDAWMKSLQMLTQKIISKFSILNTIKIEINKKSEILTHFEIKLSKLQNLVNIKERKNEKLQEVIKEIKNQESSKEFENSSLNALAQKIHNIENRTKQIEDENSELKEKNKKLQNDNTNLVRHAKVLTKKLKNSNSDSESINNSYFQCSSFQNSFSNDISSISLPRTMKSDSELDSENTKLKMQLKEEKEEKERQNEHIESLLSQNRALITQITELNETLSDSTATDLIKQLRSEIRKLKKNETLLKSLQKENEKLKKENEFLNFNSSTKSSNFFDSNPESRNIIYTNQATKNLSNNVNNNVSQNVSDSEKMNESKDLNEQVHNRSFLSENSLANEGNESNNSYSSTLEKINVALLEEDIQPRQSPGRNKISFLVNDGENNDPIMRVSYI